MTTLSKSVCVGVLGGFTAFGVTHWWANNADQWAFERQLRDEHPGSAVGVIICGPEIDLGWYRASLAAFMAYVALFTPTFLLLSAQEDRDAESARDFMGRYER
jgi:hypothetical protein